MAWIDREREIVEEVAAELAADAAFHAEYGKRVVGVCLRGQYPETRIVLEIEERRPPLTLRWSPSYEIWDGSWDRDGPDGPRPGVVAGLVVTDLMESTGAFIDCVVGHAKDDGQRTLARLEVDRFDECLRFYRDGMAFCGALRVEERDPPLAELAIGNAVLTLVPRTEHSGESDQEPTGRLYNAAMFLRVPDVEVALESLRPWGGAVGKRVGLHQRVLHVTDPDGNLIELTDGQPS